MNEHNLKPIRSVKEAREKGRKGGRASGAARRAKKTLTEELKALLQEDIITKKGEKMNTQKAISISLVNAALQGDVKAYNTIKEIVEPSKDKKADITVAGHIAFGLFWKKPNESDDN